MVVLDTNIVIDHLRASNKKDSILMELAKKLGREELAISVLTIQELYEGQNTRVSAKEEFLLELLAPMTVLPYRYEEAELAGIIARDLPRPIEFVDAAIAATAIIQGAELMTLNKKDFNGIPDLELYEAE